MEEMLTAAKCPTCGAPLEVIPETGEMKCEYCGVVTLDSRHSYSHVNVSRDFKGELEHYLENADSLLRSGLYDEAEVAYKKLLSEFSTDHRVWWGMLVADTHNFTTMGVTQNESGTFAETNILLNSAVDRAPQKIGEEYRFTYEKWVKSVEDYQRKLDEEREAAERKRRQAEARARLRHNIKNLFFFITFAVFIFGFYLQCVYAENGGEFIEIVKNNSINGVIWLYIIVAAYTVVMGIAAIIARFAHANTYINLAIIGCTVDMLIVLYQAEPDTSIGMYIAEAIACIFCFAIVTLIGRIPAKIAASISR